MGSLRLEFRTGGSNHFGRLCKKMVDLSLNKASVIELSG